MEEEIHIFGFKECCVDPSLQQKGSAMARSHYNTKKRQKELDGKKKQEEKRQAKQSKRIAEVIELERNHPDEIEDIKA